MRKLFTFQAVRPLAIAAAVLMSLGSAQAVPDAQFLPAFAVFMQANSGNQDAIDKAADAFDRLLRAEPGNPVLMAYAGAATSMKANNTMLPWKKMSHAEDGLAQLDKALGLLNASHDGVLQNNVPAVLDVKFVAANTFLAVPGFMNRGARGAKLLGEVLAHPLLPQSPKEFVGSVLMRAGQLALAEKRTDDARRYFNDVIARQASQAETARTLLKGLPS